MNVLQMPPKCYFKLHQERKAVLYSVQKVKYSKLPLVFLDYDTDFGAFKYPHNKTDDFILLHLIGKERKNIFSHLESWSHTKENYFLENIGQTFNLQYRRRR